MATINNFKIKKDEILLFEDGGGFLKKGSLFFQGEKIGELTSGDYENPFLIFEYSTHKVEEMKEKIAESLEAFKKSLPALCLKKEGNPTIEEELCLILLDLENLEEEYFSRLNESEFLFVYKAVEKGFIIESAEDGQEELAKDFVVNLLESNNQSFEEDKFIILKSFDF